MYGARGVVLTKEAQRDLREVRRLGYERLPVCIAKTPASLSDDPRLRGRPRDFDVTVRSIQINAGAGFLVALTGEILRMPGLPGDRSPSRWTCATARSSAYTETNPLAGLRSDGETRCRPRAGRQRSALVRGSRPCSPFPRLRAGWPPRMRSSGTRSRRCPSSGRSSRALWARSRSDRRADRGERRVGNRARSATTQRVVEAPLHLGLPEWIEDPHFDSPITCDTFRCRAGRRARAARSHRRTLRDAARPPTSALEATWIDGLAGGRSAFLIKLHTRWWTASVRPRSSTR